MKKIIITIAIHWMIFAPVQAKSNKKSKNSDYNIQELALPSEVENISKRGGSVYYSPSVKGKVLIPVHFWGSIKNTGLHFIPLDTNVINGISLAGGPDTNAEFDEVYLSTTRNGKRERLTLDISNGGNLALEDIKLQPGDTIFIPRDNYLQDRAYYTSLIGVIATILSSILLYREVKR